MQGTFGLQSKTPWPFSTSMDTLGSIFPGKMGRVKLTQVAIRMRRPDLLKTPLDKNLDGALASSLRSALAEVTKG